MDLNCPPPLINLNVRTARDTHAIASTRRPVRAKDGSLKCGDQSAKGQLAGCQCRRSALRLNRYAQLARSSALSTELTDWIRLSLGAKELSSPPAARSGRDLPPPREPERFDCDSGRARTTGSPTRDCRGGDRCRLMSKGLRGSHSRSSAISFRPFQNASSRLTLVLCPAITMERLITGDFIDGLLVRFDADREFGGHCHGPPPFDCAPIWKRHGRAAVRQRCVRRCCGRRACGRSAG